MAFALGTNGGITIGGNLPALRPTYTAADEAAFDLALSYLRPGDVARLSPVAWEVAWSPTSGYLYRGIDAAIKKMVAKGVVQLWELTPCPVPNGAWYSTPWPDWWLPSRDIWPGITKMNTDIVTHIQLYDRRYGTALPLFQLWNEPEGGKPGGSITSKYGEWSPDLHELLYNLVMDMRAHNIPRTQIVGPAISSFGEDGKSQAAEFASMMPPKTFDWLSECGFRDCHLRLQAPFSYGDPALVKKGFQASLDWYKWIDSQYPWPAGQQTIVSELYVTPGDCGVAFDAPMYTYHAIALDLLKTSTFKYATVWGLRPGEADVAGNPYLTYGGFGDSIVKWRSLGN